MEFFGIEFQKIPLFLVTSLRARVQGTSVSRRALRVLDTAQKARLLELTEVSIQRKVFECHFDFAQCDSSN